MDTLIVASPQSSLKEGDTVNISCKSSSVPVTKVVLSREENGADNELMTSEGAETSVILHSVKLDHSGVFVCEAFNEYGSQRTTLNLTVEGKFMNVWYQWILLV